MSFYKKVYAQTEVVALTTASPPILLYNKANIGVARRFIRVRSNNPKIYEFAMGKDKAPGSTVTNGGFTLTNAGKEFDHDDATNMSASIPGGTAESLVRQYDFGSVATRYIFYKFATDSAAGITARLYYSADGSTWTLINSASAATVSGFLKASFRYLKFTAANTASSAYNVSMYTLEVFDPNDPTQSKAPAGTNVVAELNIATLNALVSVILDADLTIAYYVYDVESAKVTISEGEYAVG